MTQWIGCVCGGIICTVYWTATTCVILEAVQKYGGDLIQLVWSEFGMMSFVLGPSFSRRTYAKFHALPSAQARCQNPSLMSHLAINRGKCIDDSQ